MSPTNIANTQTRSVKLVRPAERTARHRAAPRHHGRSSAPDRAPLGRYTDARGALREIVAIPGAAGSVLVVDRDLLGMADARLVAHLCADEPTGNAAVAARLYLGESDRERPRCRALCAADTRRIPLAEECSTSVAAHWDAASSPVLDGPGCSFRLQLLLGTMSIPELRWTRAQVAHPAGSERVASLREVIGTLECYEPPCVLTARAIAAHGTCEAASTTVIRQEFARVRESPIILNRRLREETLARIERDGISMSEIAMRCGRIKHDRKGNQSGETSWLARRLGLLPEGGQRVPTPWVHSDVLALIAREGLGIGPREVEL